MNEPGPVALDLSVARCAPSAGEIALDEERAARLASVFAALADPVRLRVLDAIVQGHEVCACHLEGPLERSQPTISHHTARLAELGLIVGERRGRWVYWRAREGSLDDVRSILERWDEAQR